MAYYRCMVSSGGSGGSSIILTVTCDSAFVGETLYLTKGLTVLSKTVPATGIVEFEFPENGTWVLSNSLTSDTETFENVGEYELDLHAIPDGKTVLPVNDIQIWLKCASIFNKSYTTLGEVLADSVTLSRLMASNNAVDYMVRSTTWAVSTSVPVMTSNTTPSGIASASSIFSSNNYAYKAFDKDTSTRWASQRPISSGGESLEYEFDSACAITKARIYNNTGYPTVGNYRIQNYVDGAWRTLYSGLNSVNNIDEVVTFVNTAKATKYRLQIDSVTEAEGAINIVELDFISEGVTSNATAMSYIGLNNYCANTLLADSTWCEAICNSEYFESVLNVKVPAMTSNTTPSGECFAIATYNPPYYAFDNNNSTYWLAGVGYETPTDVYVGYSFETSIKCYVAFVTPRQSLSAVYKIQSSADKATWGDLTESKSIPANTQNYKYTFKPDNAVRHYRIFGHSVGSGYDSQVLEVQFYGREDV